MLKPICCGICSFLVGASVFCSVPALAESPAGAQNIISETNEVSAHAAPAAVQTRDSSEMVQEMIDSFLASVGLREGANPTKKNKHVYTAVETVRVNVSNPDYAKFRVTAYDRAYAAALGAFIEAQGVKTATDTLSKAFTDNSTDAATFKEELSTGRSNLSAMLDKAIALGDAKLSTMLQEEGIDPNQFNAAPPDQKKLLLSRTILKRTIDTASKTLGGVSIAQTFFAEDEAGEGAVGIVLVYSPSIEGVAEALKADKKPAIAATGKPLHELLPLEEPAKLYDMLGTRLLVDENGPVLVSFGQWSNSYQGTSKTLAAEHRNAAYDQANAMANSELSSFLNQSFTMKNEAQKGDILENVAVLSGKTGMTSEQESKAIVDIVRKQAAMQTNAYLQGAVKLRQWRYVTPQGHEVVGVVKAFSFASIQDAKKTFSKEQASDRQKNEASARSGSVVMDLDTF